jgi:hypothetical protein
MSGILLELSNQLAAAPLVPKLVRHAHEPHTVTARSRALVALQCIT